MQIGRWALGLTVWFHEHLGNTSYFLVGQLRGLFKKKSHGKMSEGFSGMEMYHLIDGFNNYGKNDSLGRRHNCSMDRVIVGTTLVNDVWENMD